MARLAALICLLARHTNAEGGRGHAVASSTWQSTQHLPSGFIFYEDVVESSDKYAETFARVFKFIGVADQAMEASKNVAIHSDKPMLASVSNAKAFLS